VISLIEVEALKEKVARLRSESKAVPIMAIITKISTTEIPLLSFHGIENI
jgi:hypothetical protein